MELSFGMDTIYVTKCINCEQNYGKNTDVKPRTRSIFTHNVIKNVNSDVTVMVKAYFCFHEVPFNYFDGFNNLLFIRNSGPKRL